MRELVLAIISLPIRWNTDCIMASLCGSPSIAVAASMGTRSPSIGVANVEMQTVHGLDVMVPFIARFAGAKVPQRHIAALHGVAAIMQSVLNLPHRRRLRVLAQKMQPICHHRALLIMLIAECSQSVLGVLSVVGRARSHNEQSIVIVEALHDAEHRAAFGAPFAV